MARIRTVAPENADGIIKEAYDMFQKKFGLIPKPMEMMSASPALFETQLKRIHYFSTHPTLNFALLAHIRYLAARTLSYRFCMDLNGFVLKKLGLEDQDFLDLETDISKAMLEENEKAMLAFVVKSIKSPGAVTDEDIEGLRQWGWTDRDMIDALAQGVSMIDHSIMMEVFGMDQNCMLGSQG